jgi:butyryl-CoA dehydrogenase
MRQRDLDFVLYEMLECEGLCERDLYAEHSKETFDAIMETARLLAERDFAPHNADADRDGPRLENGVVVLPDAVGHAVVEFARAGFAAASHEGQWGGLGLPVTIFQACMSHFYASNISTTAYQLLTIAAANLLKSYGSETQIATYLPAMLEGRSLGTMCLSEPQAGSSLGDITTHAMPTADGHYLVKGNKMWISGGDNEITENIVHMVLARIEGAPRGVRGISLFLVPKFLINPDGTRGARNDVRVTGLNHKMGYRGTVNTALSFGDNDNCVGYLLGEPNKGLNAMFQMMNEARIAVGLGATTLGVAGYRYSLDYARERSQGRGLGDKSPDSAPVAITNHADVRRMLLAQKAWVEGALALCLFAARLVDDAKSNADADARCQAEGLLDLLTPVVKSWPSEWGLEANKLAIQVLGGYGYTRDYPVEQYYRDNRLNMIHEGTNGIQSLDLLGRKLSQHGGRDFSYLIDVIDETIASARSRDDLTEESESLEAAKRALVELSARMTEGLAGGDAELVLSHSYDYMQAFGSVVVAWLWLWQGVVAAAGLDAANTDEDRGFYRGKLQAMRYFYRHDLRQAMLLMHSLGELDDELVTVDPNWL